MAFRYSPKRNATLNQIRVEDGEPIGYTEDGGYPVYEAPEEEVKKPTSSVNPVLAAVGGFEAASMLGGSGVPATPSVVAINGAPPVAANAGALATYGPAVGAVIAAQQGYVGYGQGKGKTLSAALKQQARKPSAWLVPTRFIGASLGSIFGGGRTKVEEDRRKALAEQGIEVPNYDVKEWEENEKFRESRNEADLTGGDIENSASFWGLQGWDKLSQEQREKLAQEAIDKKLIREHHGTIDLRMTPEYEEYLKANGLGAPPPTTTNRESSESKKDRKRKKLSAIMPMIEAETTQAPRYDINPGSLITNPYL